MRQVFTLHKRLSAPVQSEKTALFRRMMYGIDKDSDEWKQMQPGLSQYITPDGQRVNPISGMSMSNLFEGPLSDPGSRGSIPDFLFGRKDVNDLLKARYDQGGLFGKGGYFHGMFFPSVSDQSMASAKRFAKGLNPYDETPLTFNDAMTTYYTGMGLKRGAGAAFNTFALPMYRAYQIFKDPGKDKAGRIGGALGSAIAGNFYSNYGFIPGMIGSVAGDFLGRTAGRLLFGDTPESPYKYSKNVDLYGRPIIQPPLPGEY
jgi:hypothetical protein